MQVSFNNAGRPRVCRWYAKGGFSYKFYSTLTDRLSKKDQVRTKMTEYSQEEQDLLGAEEEESSFEEVRRVRPRRKVKEMEELKIEKLRKGKSKEKEK